MENVILGTVLGLAIVVPVGVKWELPLRPLIVGSVVVGFCSGAIVHVLSLFIDMSFAARVLAAIFLIVATAVGIVMGRFYRDPERSSSQADDCILSPADGSIKYVKSIEHNSVPLSTKGKERVELNPAFLGILNGGKGYLIGIGMSFLDVHVTRAPMSGHLTFLEPVAGSFLSLKKPVAVQKNERLNEIIENGRYAVGVIHIASRLVKRIVPFVRAGERLVRGQRIAMIRLGSQVDVVLPNPGNLEITTAVGQRVVGGETVIALLKNTT